jgi:hypothetical protein
MTEGNCIHESNEESEDDSETKSEADHHENAADATGKCPKKAPPIKMCMKIENAHGASKLRPVMLACEQDWHTNEDENDADAGAQQ